MKLRRRALLAAVPGLAWAGRWRELWNGRDLAGWQTWLGRPQRPELDLPGPRGPDGSHLEPLGADRDPLGVFSIVRDPEPLLRISGELFGALTTREELADYHLLCEWRWGLARWPPRAQDKRDSGVLVHATGPHGASGPNKNWMRSIECQIQEGDCGDLWSVAGVAMETTARGGLEGLRYDPSGPRVFVGEAAPRIRRAVDAERPHGQWNVTEVLTVGADVVFRTNGVTVMKAWRARVREGDGWRALNRGRIQLQSEGAEILFRRVAVRPLRRLAVG